MYYFFVCFLFFFLGNGSSLTLDHFICLPECRPETFPSIDCGATSLKVAILRSLYPNSAAVGLSFLCPCAHWYPKYSSTSSWQNLSVRTNPNPSLNKNFVRDVISSKYTWTKLSILNYNTPTSKSKHSLRK